ncbi:hypothetical protein KCU67_g7872, partial [Aureobasidium melanogenum]
MGHEKIIRKLLQHGADINAECPKRGNAVAAACFAGHLTSVRLLLENKSSVPTSKTVLAALEAAFHGGHEDALIEILAHSRVQLDQAIYDSAILGASQHGFLRVIGKLQDPKLATAFAQTNPHIRINKVIGGGHIAALKRSVKDPADLLPSLPADAVSTAALYGRDQMLVFLLDNGSSIEAEGPLGSPLRVACLMNHQHVAQLLIARNADVKSSSNLGDALQAAAMKGHIQLVRLLLDNGANINAKGGIYGNALQAAAYHGHIDVVNLLLDDGADIFADGFTKDAFHAAVEGGRENVVTFLIRKGYRSRSTLMNIPPPPPLFFDAESRFAAQAPRHKNYTLMASVSLENATMVQSLLQQHLTLGLSDEEIHDSVIEAARLGKLGILRQLAEVSSEISILEALEYAADGGHIEMLEWLLEHPAVESSSKAHLLPLLHSGDACLTANGLKLLSNELSISELIDGRVMALEKLAKRGSVSPRVIQLLLETQPSIDPYRLQYIPESACLAGDHQMVLALFDALGQIDFLEEILRSCLCTSALQGHMNTVLFVVGQLSSHELGSRLELPMALAAFSGHLTVVESLYERMSDQDNAQAILSRALVAACSNSHASTVEFILSKGADVNTIAPRTVIDCVAQDRSRDLSQDNEEGLAISPLQACLMEPACLRHSRDDHAWYQDTAFERKAVLDLLIGAGANPNNLGGRENYPILYAFSHCDVEIVEDLINAGADVNTVQHSHPDYHAVERLLVRERLQQLLDAGAVLPSYKEAVNPFLNRALDLLPMIRRHQKCVPLQRALDDGPGAVIVDLLALFPEEKVTDDRYGSVLEMAACVGRKSVVQMLLERGIDIDIAGEHFGTALQAASYHGNLEMAKMLLQNGADPNILQGKHKTALRAAVVGNHEDLVTLLLENGASLETGREIKVEHGNMSQTVLHLAIQNAAVDILKILLRAGADAEIEHPGFEHLLITACEKGDHDKVEVLLGGRSPADVPGLMPSDSSLPDEGVGALRMACHQGSSQIVSLLLNLGVDPHSKAQSDPDVLESSDSAFDLAAKSGHLDCIRLVLAQETKIDQEAYGSALVKASTHGRSDVVQELLPRDLGTAYILDAFLSACQNQRLQVVEILLETLLSCGNQDTDDLLKDALENNIRNKEVFELLLDYCVVDTNTLILSCIAGSLVGVRLALENGVLVDADDALGRRGLHAAAYNRHLHIVRELVSRGASVDYVNDVYGSPLVLALNGLLADQLIEETETTQDDPDEMDFIITALPDGVRYRRIPRRYLTEEEDDRGSLFSHDPEDDEDTSDPDEMDVGTTALPDGVRYQR